MAKKVVLITGAGTGIGLASCKVFLSRGWRVVAHYFEEEPDFAKIKNDRYLTPIYSNFLGEKAGDEVFSFLREQQVDSLINCAGLPDLTTTKANRTQAAKDVFYVNVILPSLFCEAVMTQMKDRKSGTIVNVSSVGVKFGSNVNNVFYGASKSAIEAVTRTFAREGAPHNILVNSIRPGVTNTQFYNKIGKSLDDRLGLIPLKRAAEAEEIAESIYFLAASNTYITGQLLSVTGGE